MHVTVAQGNDGAPRCVTIIGDSRLRGEDERGESGKRNAVRVMVASMVCCGANTRDRPVFHLVHTD